MILVLIPPVLEGKNILGGFYDCVGYAEIGHGAS
jgi:hypothetical protein